MTGTLTKASRSWPNFITLANSHCSGAFSIEPTTTMHKKWGGWSNAPKKTLKFDTCSWFKDME